MAELITEGNSTQRFVARWIFVFAAAWVASIFYMRHLALETALPMNFDRSLFWATSALTCTGFRVTPNSLADFSATGVVGVYLMSTLGALFAMSVGGVVVCRLAALRHSPRRVLTASLTLLAAGSALGALLLLHAGRSPAHALFEATGAIANFGMTLDLYRTTADWRLHAVVLPLAALGAISVPVLLDLYDRLRHQNPISEYSRWVIHVFLAAWLVGFVLLLIMNQPLPLREGILSSWSYAINTRSLGMELNPELPRQAWWLIALLMLVGAPLGGAGGGLRLMALSTLWRRSELGELPARDVSGASAIAGASAWLALFAMLYLALLLALMSAEPHMTTDQLALVAAAALGNAGITQDPITLSTRGLILLSLGMLAGFLLPLRFAAWFVRSRP